MQEQSGRPRLSLVERYGDPQAAVALAVAVDGGMLEAAALAALTELRLLRSGLAVQTQVHGAGFSITTLCTTAAAQAFVKSSARALAQEVASSDSLPELRRRLAGMKLAVAAPHDGEVAKCSAEPLLLANRSQLPPNDAEARAELEQWRARISAAGTGYSVVGPSATLQAVRDIVTELPPFANAEAFEDADSWPQADSLSVGRVAGEHDELAIALRVPEPGPALWAARELGKKGSLLAKIGQALDPHWRISRVTAITRPRGACLRVDLRAEGKGPDVAAAAGLVQLVQSEANELLGDNTKTEWMLQDSILERDDPRDAARVAAWQAIGGRLEPGPIRAHVRYTSARSDPPSVEQFNAARRRQLQPELLATRTAVEPGHSKLSVLLASPCGTQAETSGDAGISALMVSSIAEQQREEGAAISPWITADALGVLGEFAWLGPRETALQQAERAARALADALISAPGADAIHRARRRLFETAVLAAPDWWLTLETLAPGQLSALEPRGSYTSLGALVYDEVRASQRLFTSGPLRVAVLAGASKEQGAVLERELKRLLLPLRVSERRCPQISAVRPGTGLLRVETAYSPLGDALVAVSLPGANSWQRQSEAEWTALLLNRSGGWLDQKLIATRLASGATARVVGGQRARALVIELHTNGKDIDRAVIATRELLVELARGRATQGDADFAQRYFSVESGQLLLDPRQRLVTLWHGTAASTPPSLTSLRRFHAQTLQEQSHLVVTAEQRG